MISELRRLFKYDPETGAVTRLVVTSNRVRIGDIVGSKKTTHRGKNYAGQYLQVRVNSKLMYVHRIAYSLMTGEHIPNGVYIDHVNGDGTDNRWANMRLATRSQNMANIVRKTARQTNLPKGVQWHDRDKLYVARLGNRAIGYFKDVSKAAAAYNAAARERYGPFYREDGGVGSKGSTK